MRGNRTAMSDNQLTQPLLGVGVTFLVIMVVRGIIRSRRKARNGLPAWSVAVQRLGDQPYIATSNVTLRDTTQWQLFQEKFPIGSAVSVPDDAAPPLHISAVKQSMRSGWPVAKAGFTAYFEEYAGSELPATFPLKGGHRFAAVNVNAEGLSAVDAQNQCAWHSDWDDLVFSNGTDLILRNDNSTIRLEPLVARGSVSLEEVVIKYATFKPMHY
jgi:hypothetical protein